MSNKNHWEKIYIEKNPNEVSWTQEVPDTSINFFNSFNLDKSSPIIDIGGGESRFVDYLIENGFNNISILDISENAINRVRERLGKNSKRINWIITDINDFNPKIKYSFWHDRALFHFLTEKKQIKRYTEIVNSYARNFLVGTFSKLGPKGKEYGAENTDNLIADSCVSSSIFAK